MKLLNKIQQELNAPKNLRNSFGNYNYRNAESILEAVKPLLGESGTLTLNEEIVQIGARYYVKSTATLTDGTESVSVSAYAREPEIKKGMDEAQITGATISYARKYALGGLCLLDDSKDDPDSKDNSKEGTREEPTAKKSDKVQHENIKTLSEKLKQDKETLMKAILWASEDRTSAVASLTQAEAAKLIGALTAKIAKLP